MENQTVARSGSSLGKRSRNQLLEGYWNNDLDLKTVEAVYNAKQ